MEPWQTCIWSCIPQIYGSLKQAKAIKSFPNWGAGGGHLTQGTRLRGWYVVAVETRGRELQAQTAMGMSNTPVRGSQPSEGSRLGRWEWITEETSKKRVLKLNRSTKSSREQKRGTLLWPWRVTGQEEWFWLLSILQNTREKHWKNSFFTWFCTREKQAAQF